MGSFATFLDRNGPAVFGIVTERRRHTDGARLQQAELSLSFLLRATWRDIRDTCLHEIAHAIVGPGHGHDAVSRTTAPRMGLHGQAPQRRHVQPEPVDGEVPPVPRSGGSANA